MQCLRVGLNSYALETVEELKTMMTSVGFKTFKQDFDKLMAEIESNLEDW